MVAARTHRTGKVRHSLAGLGLWAVLLCYPLRLQASPGTGGASFLDIPVGAGPASLGSAYSALATDAYATVWNPGGLGFLDSTQVAAQHLSYLESVSYEFVSVVHPLRPGDALGLSAQYVGSGDITATNKLGVTQGTYSNEFGAYSLAYGHALTDRVALGATGKLIHIKLSDVSANAFAGDLGGLWRATDHLNFAAVVANAGSPMKFLSSSDPLPLAFHLGAAYAPSRHWIVTGETVVPRTGQPSGRAGVEWRPMEYIALRTGYRTDTLKELSALAGFSTGIGLQVWGQEFAYAWVPYGDLGNSQYVSLVLRFGGPEKENRNLIQYQHTQFQYESGDTSRGNGEGAGVDDEALYQVLHARQSEKTAQSGPETKEGAR